MSAPYGYHHCHQKIDTSVIAVIGILVLGIYALVAVVAVAVCRLLSDRCPAPTNLCQNNSGSVGAKGDVGSAITGIRTVTKTW